MEGEKVEVDILERQRSGSFLADRFGGAKRLEAQEYMNEAEARESRCLRCEVCHGGSLAEPPSHRDPLLSIDRER